MILSESKIKSIIRDLVSEERRSLGAAVSDTLGRMASKNRSSSDDSADAGVINFKFTSSPNSSAVAKAKTEANLWKKGDGSKLKETENEAQSILKKYWDNIGWGKGRWKTETPWSAAFISYVMGQAGDGKFFKSAAHTGYALKAYRNRLRIINNPEKFKGKTAYVLFLKGEANPEPGDVTYKVREGGDWNGFLKSKGDKSFTTPSHSDIVISTSKGIGGNLSNSAGETGISEHLAVIKRVTIGDPLT